MDYGHSLTDKMLNAIERKIATNYKLAQEQVQKKAEASLSKFQEKDKKMFSLMKSGKITNDEYLEWRKNNMLSPSYLKDLSDTLASDLTNADKIAAKIINDELPNIYALNANYGMYEVDSMLGVRLSESFSLYDHDTVNHLLKKNPEVIPFAKVNVPKDTVWNRKKLTSALTQGILSGDSIPHIASRLQSVANMDRRAAIRNARTYTTAAESSGRLDGYMRAKSLGVNLKQKWIATFDERTRQSHREMDEETVEVGELFSNGLRYPGDPRGEPEEFYNCRCRTIAVDPMFEDEDAEMFAERCKSLPEGMTYEEWKAGAQKKDA